MRLLRRRWFLASLAAVALVALGAWRLSGASVASGDAVQATATRGDFAVIVMTSGELRAREAVQITVPPNAQQAGAYQMRIQSLVPEGTLVRAGDVVCELDRSTLASRLTDVTLNLQKAEAQFEQAQLDSTLTLSSARENIRTMELSLEEKRLARDQAQYEAPTIRRQAEIDYERADRALTQARADYVTRTEQARAKMREVSADRDRQRSLLQTVQQVMAGFTIRAPSPGMVIYVKEWNGRKRTTGSQVTSWDPAVATLPDLTHMESVTYVNEIDVRRIAIGQPVRITLDADPDKHLTGRVASVANVGEQRPNADAKVFEVRVTVIESDTTLRPGMTTGNAIETLRVPDALAVPLEAIFSAESLTYVYKASGSQLVRQEVVTGEMNDHDAIIVRGLDEGDRVQLSTPLEAERLSWHRLPADSTAASAPVPPAPPPADSGRRRPAPRGDSAAPRP